MVAQAALAREFARGAESGTASNIRIETDTNGVAHLIGYGWAIYATREAGQLTLYEGWRGYSMSTTCQMTELRKGFRQAGVEFDTDDEKRPNLRSRSRAVVRTR